VDQDGGNAALICGSQPVDAFEVEAALSDLQDSGLPYAIEE
jgi:hypothetical protein